MLLIFGYEPADFQEVSKKSNIKNTLKYINMYGKLSSLST